MQPQGHVQVIMNLLDFGHNPQAALDAPRWQWLRGGRKVNVENTLAAEIINGLVEQGGHEITVTKDSGGYGRGQIVFKSVDDVLVGATESRIDGGAVAAW